MDIVLFISAIIASGFIIYQDLTSRRINLLLVLLFIAIIAFRYAVLSTSDQILQNVAFCSLYFLLSYMILKLYFFVKGKGKERIIDSKIGWGDIILFFAAGCTIEPERLVFFFTIVFVLSLLLHMLFMKKHQQIPLAAYLLIFYNFYLLVFSIT